MNKPKLYTIGYAPHDLEDFLGLLRGHGITAVADVRSVPASAFRPEYGRDRLPPALEAAGIDYVFLGDLLGVRREEPALQTDGVPDLLKLADTPGFRRGLTRLRDGMRRFVIALLCAEKDPLSCHRAILVSRHLKDDADILHILGDGSLEPQDRLEQRLLRKFDLDQLLLPGLAETEGGNLDLAYRRQGREIARRTEDPEEQEAG